MRWYSLAINPKAITSVFGELPPLESVSLFGIVMDRDGPCVQLRFDVDKFPDHPPKKWLVGYSQVQLTVNFIDIEDVLIDRWGRNNEAQLRITDVGVRKSVLVQGDECSIRFTCHAFRIISVSGYSVEK